MCSKICLLDSYNIGSLPLEYVPTVSDYYAVIVM